MKKTTSSTTLKKKDPHFISTYSRIALSEWKPIVKIIHLHSKFVKEIYASSIEEQENFSSLDQETSFSEKNPELIHQKLEDDEHNEYEKHERDDEHEDDEISDFEKSLSQDFAAEFGDEFQDDFGFHLEEEDDDDEPIEKETIKEPKIETHDFILPSLITVKEIEYTLAGPYQAFLKIMITAFAKIARTRYEKNIKKEDLYKGQRAKIHQELHYSEKKLDNISFSMLDEMQENLNKLTELYHSTWQKFYYDCVDEIVEKSKLNNLMFTAYEIRELHYEEPMVELLPKFIELNLKTPQLKDQITFTQYLKIKMHLTLQTALSRQHLQHTDLEIAETLKRYKAEFSKMEKTENNMIKQQYKEVKKLLKDSVGL